MVFLMAIREPKKQITLLAEPAKNKPAAIGALAECTEIIMISGGSWGGRSLPEFQQYSTGSAQSVILFFIRRRIHLPGSD
jgi:hypothetical protein